MWQRQVMHGWVDTLVRAGLAAGQVAAWREPSVPPPRATLAYGADRDQALDVWVPHPPRGPAPLILFLHGGGWAGGNRHTTTGRTKIAAALARGWAFATADYRLVPRARVEQQAGDVRDALAVMRARGPDLGIDPARIVLMGHSAGAHLAALAVSDPGLAGGAWPAGLVLVDGAAYDVAAQIAAAPWWLRPLYLEAFGTDRGRWQALSPAHHAARGLPAPVPPLLLMHARRADAMDQAHAMAAAWRVGGGGADVAALPGRGLAGHVASNRRLGEPGWPGTGALDRWLDCHFRAPVT